MATLDLICELPKEGLTYEGKEDVFIPGFGSYQIHSYTKGRWRYFELTGTPEKHLFCTSIKRVDREDAIRTIKLLVGSPRNGEDVIL